MNSFLSDNRFVAKHTLTHLVVEKTEIDSFSKFNFKNLEESVVLSGSVQSARNAVQIASKALNIYYKMIKLNLNISTTMCSIPTHVGLLHEDHAYYKLPTQATATNCIS